MKILIVDDNDKNLAAAKKASEHFPEYKFIFTENAAEALSLIGNGEVDAVITDFFFPRAQPVDQKSYRAYIAEFKRNVNYAICQIPRDLQPWAYDQNIDNNLDILKNSGQAAYGGVIALACLDHLPFVIITDMHRHRLDWGYRPPGNYRSHQRSRRDLCRGS